MRRRELKAAYSLTTVRGVTNEWTCEESLRVGRPFDKKTRTIRTDETDSVTPVVRYLQHKLGVVFAVPEFRVDPRRGIVDVDTSVNWLIQDLRARRIGGVYLPNTRWFGGEEGLAAAAAAAAGGGRGRARTLTTASTSADPRKQPKPRDCVSRSSSPG